MAAKIPLEPLGPPFVVRVSPVPSRGAVQLAWPGATQPVEVRIFDVSGALRRSVNLAPGSIGYRWDGEDERGVATAAGIYFARVRSAGVTRVTRVVRAR